MARNKGKGSSAVLGDAARTAEDVPLNTAPQGAGGSVMTGDLITEPQFLPTPKPQWIDSPFGQRYLADLSRSKGPYEYNLRCEMWSFNIFGYCMNTSMPDSPAASITPITNFWLDWYGLVRDMAKKSLKYKHTPTAFTAPNVNLMPQWLCTYYRVLVNLIVLLNLLRLGQYNPSLAYYTRYIPQFASRINREYRRMSAIPAPNLLKAHAMRNGQILNIQHFVEPTIRLWTRSESELAVGSGGPPVIAPADVRVMALLDSATNLGAWVTMLEDTRRWLEVGSSAIAVDFTAMKDLIDMTCDILPGAWVTGLPDSKTLPGLSTDWSVYNDLYCRAVTSKVDVNAGTDQWCLYPPTSMGVTMFGNDIVPIQGLGTPDIYTWTLMGAPKFGTLNNDGTLQKADVNVVKSVLYGTDFHRKCYTTISDNEFIDSFGLTGSPYDEEVCNRSDVTPQGLKYSIDDTSSATLNDFATDDTRIWRHHWGMHALACAAAHTVPKKNQFANEARVNYRFFAEPTDFVENYLQMWAIALGVPFIR